MSTERLLMALRGASEGTRLRILALLSCTELTVSELTRILDQSQPRVSRHLKLMCDSGLLERTQEGSWVFYRIADRGDTGGNTAHALLSLLEREPSDSLQDMQRLELIRAEHVEEAAQYFRENAAKWDVIRSLYLANHAVEHAMLAAVDGEIRDHLDIGTGTGQILRLFGPHVQRALGIDSSREMLSVARANLESAELPHCQVRHGDLMNLPINNGAMDLVTIHHVLHFLDDPAAAITSAAKTLGHQGLALIVDFAPHSLEVLRTEHAHRRLGFSDDEVTLWCHQAGLNSVERQLFHNAAHLGEQALSVCLWTARKQH